METKGKSVTTPIGQAIHLSGTSVQRVADDLSVTRGAVYKWINGEAVPDKDRMASVCRYLGITPNDVYGFKQRGGRNG